MLRRKILRFLGLVCCLGLILPVGLPTQPARGQSESNFPDLDIILVIDQSNSMFYQNDPWRGCDQGPCKYPGWRIVMANLFVDLLGIDQSGPSHQLGILMFGYKNEWVSHLADISQVSTRENIKIELKEKNVFMVTTHIPEAIEAAQAELDSRGRDGSKKAIVFLSDGVCQYRDNPPPEEVADCNRRIDDLVSGSNYPVYTIALTEEAFQGGELFQVYKNIWQQIAAETGGLYFEPKKAEGELLRVYTKIIEHLLGLPPDETRPPVESPIEIQFDIPDRLLQVIFSVIKYEDTVETSIIRPDGTLIDPSNLLGDVRLSKSSLTDVYSVFKPDPGTWTVRLTGRGKANIIKIQFPLDTLKVNQFSPTAFHPAGKPMDIWIEVVNGDDEPQQVSGLSVDILKPDQSTQTLNLEPYDGDTYRAVLEDTLNTGQYVLDIHDAPGETDHNQVKSEFTVSVVKAPWLKVVQPETGGTYPQPLEVVAQTMFGMEPFSPGPTETAGVSVILLSTEWSSDPMLLALQSDGTLRGELTAQTPGSYILHADLSYANETTGENFVDITEIPVIIGGVVTLTPSPSSTHTATPPASTDTATIEPSPTATNTPLPPPPTDTPQPSPTTKPTIPPSPTATPTPPTPPPTGAIFGGLGVLIALLAAGGAGWWWFSKPSFSGMLTTSSGELLPLTGKSRIYFGSDPKCKYNIQGANILPKHAELRPIGNRRTPSVEIRSLDSIAPVRVNGYETTYQILHEGDKIEIGDQTYTYSGPSGGDTLSLDDPFASGSGNIPFEPPMADGGTGKTEPTNPNNTPDPWKFEP